MQAARTARHAPIESWRRQQSAEPVPALSSRRLEKYATITEAKNAENDLADVNENERSGETGNQREDEQRTGIEPTFSQERADAR